MCASGDKSGHQNDAARRQAAGTARGKDGRKAGRQSTLLSGLIAGFVGLAFFAYRRTKKNAAVAAV